jgi:hypothetical protein
VFYTFGARERNVLQCLRVLRSRASAGSMDPGLNY